MFNNAWDDVLADELADSRFAALLARLDELYATRTVYPLRENVFRALELTPPEAVRCVILGQDPYHGAGQAHGLAFSVPAGVRVPPSLRNIFKELHDDVGVPVPPSGDLSAWAQRGVLLLNAILTVEDGKPLAHKDLGWQWFTSAVLRHLCEREQPIVYFLWGKNAQDAAKGLPFNGLQRVVRSAHPSPLSARYGFFGSRPFGQVDIDWRL